MIVFCSQKFGFLSFAPSTPSLISVTFFLWMPICRLCVRVWVCVCQHVWKCCVRNNIYKYMSLRFYVYVFCYLVKHGVRTFVGEILCSRNDCYCYYHQFCSVWWYSMEKKEGVCSQVIEPVVNLLQKSHFFQAMSACVEKY